jgi:hypothetical protein
MSQFRFIGDPKAKGHGPDSQELYGLTFFRDRWTDVPDELVERVSRHSHLEAAPKKKAEAAKVADTPSGDPVADRGRAARADGKERSVPPVYRGKPEAERWLTGYDEAGA